MGWQMDESAKLARLIVAINAINIARTLKTSMIPSLAPLHKASIELTLFFSILMKAPAFVSLFSDSGISIFAINRAPGALRTEAVIRCPASIPNVT